ncbi:MAG: methionine biosynthesis protein MetW [Candidatus Saganbacteria bacterium]|nr:methionine biosynthesis protein MetW [Candidatus Saganbacteria bacterium]
MPDKYKPDYNVIVKWVEPGSRVLDVGCGEGSLLERLITEKNIRGVGVDKSPGNLNVCIAKGLNVIQVDLDIQKGLRDFPDKTFDYVILNDTLQALEHPLPVLLEMLRLGKKVIVGFPNFAHIVSRSYLFFQGKMPMSKTLPYMWYDTPNIHFMTINDFRNLCKEQKIKVLKEHYLGERFYNIPAFFANLFASEAVYLVNL